MTKQWILPAWTGPGSPQTPVLRACYFCGKALSAHAGFIETIHQPDGLRRDFCSAECLHWQLHEDEKAPDVEYRCDRCHMPAVQVDGGFQHADAADAAFCQLVMRGGTDADPE